ncbi:hypothetical protein [Nocardia sp. NPDC059229]|uniref:hypothetical protein n=1 Tax=Nocardia sp. NPDC059229 TaxID=3346778 RepID=UPI0036B7F20B
MGKLHELLESEAPNQDILDMYNYTKKLLAESMKALFLSTLPNNCPTFHEVRTELAVKMKDQWGEHIPDRYLTVPYGSKTHETLFAVLLQWIGKPVSADWLRFTTQDSVHTERRTRELRELGLQIQTGKSSGADVYTLQSLMIDTAFVPSIIKNNLRMKHASDQEKAEVLAILGLENP